MPWDTGIPGHWMKMLDTEYWTMGSGRWTVDAKTLDAGGWTLDSGLWRLDAGLRMLDAEFWMLSSGHWTLLLTGSEQNQNPIADSAWLNYWKVYGCKSQRTFLCSRLLCKEYGSNVAVFFKFYINVKFYDIKGYRKKFLLWEIELHYKQLSATVHLFSKISPENTGGRVFLLVKLQTDC